MNKTITENEAIELLKKYAKDNNSFEKVYRHSRTVQKISLRFAEKIDCDKDFIRIASLIHDIGRFECPPKSDKVILHGICGAKILRDEGLSEKYALVCERHLGAGISKEAIIEQKLNLPLKDYIPISIEEKIITVADNLAFGDKEGTIEEVEKRYREELGEKVAKTVMDLYDEVCKCMI